MVAGEGVNLRPGSVVLLPPPRHSIFVVNLAARARIPTPPKGFPDSHPALALGRDRLRAKGPIALLAICFAYRSGPSVLQDRPHDLAPG